MKKALLIGSNGYLGEFWAKELVEKGYETFGISIGSNGKYIHQENFFEYDVSNKDWPDYIENLLQALRPSAIIYNSGIDSPPGQGFSQFKDFDMEGWRKIFEVNLFAAVSVLNAISEIPDLNCRIILIGSQYASVSPNKNLYSHQNNGNGSIKHPGYSASKSALKAVMKQYATELADKGLVINMLSPGGIANNQDIEFLNKFAERIPLRRLGEREELGSALNFLLDENNTFCIGLDLLIDGGYSTW